MSFIMRYKGKYRLLCPYDKETNQYPRKLNGTFEDIDVYISCYNKIQITYYGKSILQAYIPSLQRGRNIIESIKNDLGDEIVFDINITNSEVIFKFHSKYMEQLGSYLKPKTSGANISPYSNKNLPRNKAYKIPDEDLTKYKEIIENMPQERKLEIGYISKSFIKSLSTKKNTYEDMKAEMIKTGLKGKEYIHSIGKWREFLLYLRKNLAVN